MKTKTPFETWLDDIDNEDLINNLLVPIIGPYDQTKDDIWKRFAKKIWQHEQQIFAKIKPTSKLSGGETD